MKTDRKERTITLFAVSLGIIVLLFLVLMYKVEDYNRIPIQLEIHNVGSTDTQNTQMSISMEMSKSWWDRGVIGAEFDGIIINDTDDNIHNWTMIIHLPMKGELDSSWNGEYEFINKTDILFSRMKIWKQFRHMGKNLWLCNKNRECD